MQQSFYNEITERYNEYVNYLRQANEYDLEVEAMDLQAETISLRPVIMGKGGQSAFGDDSVLETVMANVLKKPLSKTELNAMIDEALQGKQPEELQRQFMDEFKAFQTNQLELDIRENDTHYRKLIDEIPSETKLQKLLKAEGEEVYQVAVAKRKEELENACMAAEVNLRKPYIHREQLITSIAKRFYIGRLLNYPVSRWNGEATIPAVFLGIVVDKKRKNPFAPSALRFRFALANGYRYIVLAGSQTDIIHKIISTSIDIAQPDRSELLDFWETTIKESTADRKIRHIITGNVLQAFSEYHGKLVSYTTLKGETRKGILMPDYWEAPAEGKQGIIVPVSRAIKVIRSMTVGSAITTNTGVSIFRTSDHYKIMVAAARSKGGDIYLDEDILKLVNRNIFEKVSDKMTALLELDRIDRFVKILEDKHGDSISLNHAQYEMIPKSTQKRERPPLSNPILTIPVNTSTDSELELEALALELELELLNFAA